MSVLYTSGVQLNQVENENIESAWSSIYERETARQCWNLRLQRNASGNTLYRIRRKSNVRIHFESIERDH